MKHNLLLFFFLVLMQPIRAASKDCMLVHFTNGSRICFMIDKLPTITFKGEYVNVANENFLFCNIVKYFFVDSDEASIKNILTQSNTYYISADGKKVYVKVNNSHVPVRLYKVNGIEIPLEGRMTSTYEYVIDISQFASEVLLLKIGNQSVKILRP